MTKTYFDFFGLFTFSMSLILFASPFIRPLEKGDPKIFTLLKRATPKCSPVFTVKMLFKMLVKMLSRNTIIIIYYFK